LTVTSCAARVKQAKAVILSALSPALAFLILNPGRRRRISPDGKRTPGVNRRAGAGKARWSPYSCQVLPDVTPAPCGKDAAGKPKLELSDARIAVLVVKKGDSFIYATAEDEYMGMVDSPPADLRKQLESFFASMTVKL
jgi:hypothetical protein